jgi:hypothetical protein
LTEIRYSEGLIGSALARATFKDCVLVVDRCSWPGDECDLLVVTPSLRVVDVEIKVSRADLKRDREKDKWHEFLSYEHQRALTAQLGRRPTRAECRRPREWPRRVWKHYYAVAAPIWKDELLEHCNPTSGVLVVELGRRGQCISLDVKRRAKPRPDHEPLKPEQVVAIARLAGLRMWDAYKDLERVHRDLAKAGTAA